jgi:hypothetical protein
MSKDDNNWIDGRLRYRVHEDSWLVASDPDEDGFEWWLSRDEAIRLAVWIIDNFTKKDKN